MFVDFQSVATVVALLISAVALWRSFRKDRSEADDQKFKDLSTRVGAVSGKVELVEDRVAAVEGELRHLPDKDVTHRIELALSDMKAEMRGLSEGVKPLKGMVERVHEALVEKAVG
ncbi:MAG: hypothetical protein ACRC9K_12275 [Afipia sp.]